MGLDHEFRSTLVLQPYLVGYVFAGMMVCAITTIAIIAIVMKGQGYLEFVNDSHIHDLGKYMFPDF